MFIAKIKGTKIGQWNFKRFRTDDSAILALQASEWSNESTGFLVEAKSEDFDFQHQYSVEEMKLTCLRKVWTPKGQKVQLGRSTNCPTQTLAKIEAKTDLSPVEYNANIEITGHYEVLGQGIFKGYYVPVLYCVGPTTVKVPAVCDGYYLMEFNRLGLWTVTCHDEDGNLTCTRDLETKKVIERMKQPRVSAEKVIPGFTCNKPVLSLRR